MNRNSGNVSKTKKVIPGTGTNSKHNRKLFQELSDSSSISSNRNSSAHSDEDVRETNAYARPQVDGTPSCEEQDQLMRKLQSQIKELRHKLRVLEESVDSKDYSLGTIAKEKDRAIGEIKRLERSNKLLRQQLNDERNHYLEEKEKFCEEMTKYKKKLQETKSVTNPKKSAPSSKQSLINQSLKWQLNKEKGDFEDRNTRMDLRQSKSQNLSGVREKKSVRLSTLSLSDCQIHRPSTVKSFNLYEGDDVSLQMAALRTENAKLRSIISERDERNYELCLRFLRMKHYKNDIKNRFQDLENEYLQVIANLMDKIDEARQEFNFIIDQKFKRPLHSTNAMYLQMVQRNSRMTFENASLRLENQCLKKELNKHVHGSSEFDRKNDLATGKPTAADVLDSKPIPGDQKGDAKMKRTKKNVNFNEIRTIYERDLNFKNSDTDSNYMSKTSTTVPSNGSLEDPKSNESIVGADQNPENITPNPKFQPNSIPNEILHKIFKRIDSSSCQTINSRSSKLEAKLKMTTNEAPKPKSDAPLPDKSPIIIEQKSPLKISSSSSPCESKESIRFDPKETSYSPRTKEPKNETGRKQGWGLRNRIKSRVRGGWYFDRDSEDGGKNGALDFPVRRFTLVGRARLGKKDKDQQNQIPTRTRLKVQYGDSCGLQENVEFSDLEPTEVEMDNLKEKEEEEEIRTEAIESDEEESEKIGRRQTPAVGSRSRSSNKVNLQDELMEAWRNQRQSDDASWRKDVKLQSVQSQTTASRNEENLQCDIMEPQGALCVSYTDCYYILQEKHSNMSTLKAVRNGCSSSVNACKSCCSYPLNVKAYEELSGLFDTEDNQEPDAAQQKRPEGSKRFSHRLMSTSPEQLRNILTESQMGTFRLVPIIVNHATTEVTPAINYEDPNDKELLPLVTSFESLPKTSLVFLENAEKLTVDKETSELKPVEQTKSAVQMEICSSDLRLPMSSLPTSTSTMEMVDSAAFDRSNVMMRTLSAPGLLESNWLDPFTVCEMRDCGTNT